MVPISVAFEKVVEILYCGHLTHTICVGTKNNITMSFAQLYIGYTQLYTHINEKKKWAS